ncbi:hypothetical protein V500_08252 [Pseudogymnoascus sp. VKM F-4518 (FW-2643)]|nr:hypothetical protein V500_08252 [Pseudogymnoascus sp. VKM F-4518 (FW-2643)]
MPQTPEESHVHPAPQREIPTLHALAQSHNPSAAARNPTPPESSTTRKQTRISARKQTKSPNRTAPYRTEPPAQSHTHLPAATEFREPKEPISASRRTFSQDAIGSEHHFLTLRTPQKNPCRPTETPRRNPENGDEETSNEKQHR